MFSVGLCVLWVLCGPSKATARCYTSICDGIIKLWSSQLFYFDFYNDYDCYHPLRLVLFSNLIFRILLGFYFYVYFYSNDPLRLVLSHQWDYDDDYDGILWWFNGYYDFYDIDDYDQTCGLYDTAEGRSRPASPTTHLDQVKVILVIFINIIIII